jgi:hypothetical protein
MSLENASIGSVKPGEQKQVLPRCHPMQRGSERRIDLQESFRRSLKRLIGRVAKSTKA